MPLMRTLPIGQEGYMCHATYAHSPICSGRSTCHAAYAHSPDQSGTVYVSRHLCVFSRWVRNGIFVIPLT